MVFSPMALLNDGKAYDSAAICMFSAFDESTGTMQLAEDYQFLDYGLDLYAPQSTTDEDGNRIVIAWMRMPQAVDGKWNGMMCIPRVISVKSAAMTERLRSSRTRPESWYGNARTVATGIRISSL